MEQKVECPKAKRCTQASCPHYLPHAFSNTLYCDLSSNLCGAGPCRPCSLPIAKVNIPRELTAL
jgi:hypothetical protein